MPIDPAGTTPGLAQPVPEKPKEHNMKCKNKNCDSITVIEVPVPQAPGRHLYQCTKCRTTWGVNTGGAIDLG